MDNLFTPWRYAYIKGESPPEEECFLCTAGRRPDDPERLVVATTAHHVVLLNRHPYTNGHLMIAPRDHVAWPGDLPPAARDEFWPLVLRAEGVLRRVYRPHGLNLGMNLGRSAGAGVPDHYHLHLVPRWEGDTNFMSVVAAVRLVPQDLRTSWEVLRQAFADEEV